MDAALLTSDDFWSATRPQVLGAFDGALPDDPRLSDHVLFGTSGTTGSPKWIALSKRALMASATTVNAWLGVDPSACWGLALPAHHVGGFGVIARARAANCRLAHFAGRWDAAACAAWLDAAAVTHTSLVPTQVHDLVAAGLRAPSALRAIVVGGGALPVTTGQAARDLGWPVLASYGMTEAASQIATQPLDALKHPYQSAPIPLLDHWQVKVDADGRLAIAGRALFSGTLVHGGDQWIYHPRQEEWFVTNDRANLDGRMLAPLGRADMQVKVLGELVDLGRIEARLAAHADGAIPVGSLVVVAVPDARAGHLLVPVFDATLDRQVVDAAWRGYAGEAPGFARLQAPRFLDPLPRSALGKPLRAECVKRLGPVA